MATKVDYKNTFVIENIPVEELMAHPENPKLHPQAQLEAIDASLKEFGWLLPLIVNKRTGRILDGHGRFETEGNRGLKVFPCRVVDVDYPTELRIIASLDRVGEMRLYDDAALAALLTQCVSDGGILPGWTEDNIEDLLRSQSAPPAVAAREVSERAPDASGVAGSEAEAPSRANGEGGEGGDVRQPSQVRMVQLFFSSEEFEEYEALVGAAANAANLNTPSDAVLAALRGYVGNYNEELEGNP